MNNKIIKDIRIYDKKHLFKIDKELALLATRFGRKLQELQFEVKENQTFNIYLTNKIKDGSIETYSDHNLQSITKGIQEINYGLDIESFNSLSLEEKKEISIKLIGKIMSEISRKNNLSSNIVKINVAVDQILKYGSDVEIVYKTYDYAKYNLIFSYKINPQNGDHSPVILHLNDLTSGEKFKQSILDLEYYEHIFYLIGSVKIIGNKIIVKHQRSQLSNMNLKKYMFPIESFLKNGMIVSLV